MAQQQKYFCIQYQHELHWEMQSMATNNSSAALKSVIYSQMRRPVADIQHLGKRSQLLQVWDYTHMGQGAAALSQSTRHNASFPDVSVSKLFPSKGRQLSAGCYCCTAQPNKQAILRLILHSCILKNAIAGRKNCYSKHNPTNSRNNEANLEKQKKKWNKTTEAHIILTPWQVF